MGPTCTPPIGKSAPRGSRPSLPAPVEVRTLLDQLPRLRSRFHALVSNPRTRMSMDLPQDSVQPLKGGLWCEFSKGDCGCARGAVTQAGGWHLVVAHEVDAAAVDARRESSSSHASPASRSGRCSSSPVPSVHSPGIRGQSLEVRRDGRAGLGGRCEALRLFVCPSL